MKARKLAAPLLKLRILFGEPGIGPGLYAPEAYVLPVYYSPNKILNLEACACPELVEGYCRYIPIFSPAGPERENRGSPDFYIKF